jgi:hypothetical protein
MIDHKCFNLSNIINIANNLVDLISNLASIYHATKINEKWKNILNDINLEQISTFAEIGKIIFNFILSEISQIKKDIFEMSIFESIGLNYFMLK